MGRVGVRFVVGLRVRRLKGVREGNVANGYPPSAWSMQGALGFIGAPA